MGTGETGEDEKDRGIGFRSGGRDSMREKEGGGGRERDSVLMTARGTGRQLLQVAFISLSLSLFLPHETSVF